MFDAFARLLGSSSSFLPHGYCFTWSPAVLWSMVAGDTLIAAAYFSIPIALMAFVRKRKDMHFNWMMKLFSTFIFLCGTTHLLSIWTIWQPAYWLEAGVKLATGAVSIVTAALLWPLIPKALRIPSINQLQAAIARLETEAVERRRAEARLAQMNAELERRIQERTQELEREVAERQRLQDADRARQAAELASSAKSEFLSRMSHELRTPLNAVLGFAQLSARSLSDGDTARTRSYLQHIEDGGWHLVRMIDDILDISRIEQGRQTFTIGAVDLGPVVAEAGAMVQPLATTQQVVLTLDLPGFTPPVRADRTRLIQVMTNLLSNATKFNRPGGEVHVSLAPADEEHVRIEVRDTGLGMSALQLSQLFQPFNRLGRERLGIPGTGIGLVLVRHLVEQMGGSIEVNSTEGVGTTFAITLVRDGQVPVAALPPLSGTLPVSHGTAAALRFAR
ncbi:sensor histidine kinase [Ideonella sp. BN130291]|uniref:sensor histidine kinase n=1 Tax=Ideonella sp. BN130291 TaxID=3112940 RepID=UPI002E26F408|nr:ATP-binding protein [Ideonella sp. BN130291]